jgi:rRNA-processing protein FCF1
VGAVGAGGGGDGGRGHGRARRDVGTLVILDTNALLLPFELGLDLESEIAREMGRCRVVVPEAVLAELRSMAIEVADARAALRYAERFEVVPTEGRGDEAVLGLAVQERAVVVTVDRGLLERLRAEGLRVLRPRERHRLELV